MVKDVGVISRRRDPLARAGEGAGWDGFIFWPLRGRAIVTSTEDCIEWDAMG